MSTELARAAHRLQMKAIDVQSLADSGADSGLLSLAISDLRDAVTEFAGAARRTNKRNK